MRLEALTALKRMDPEALRKVHARAVNRGESPLVRAACTAVLLREACLHKAVSVASHLKAGLNVRAALAMRRALSGERPTFSLRSGPTHDWPELKD